MSAYISVPGGTDLFTFIAARTDAGHVLDQAAIEEEPLETEGVDGCRWRTVRLKHNEFKITTVAAFSNFDAAITAAKGYMRAKGRNCSYSSDEGGDTYLFKNLHVLDVAPVPTAGAVVGGGASSNAQAHVVCVWTVIPTNFAASDSANA